jgi:hypothetical protein
VSEYKFKGIILTGSIAAEILCLYFKGKTIASSSIVDECEKLHLSNGGLRNSTANRVGLKKAAAKLLVKYKLAQNPASGVWKIDSTAVFPDYKHIRYGLNPGEDLVKLSDKFDVYAYYHSYEKKQFLQSGTQWPIKIGYTERGPIERILAQCMTAFAFKPILLLTIECKQDVESAIHCILKARKRRIGDSTSKEWFLTNTEEIIEIIKFVYPDAKITIHDKDETCE